MNKQNLVHQQLEIPISDLERKSTDLVCTVIGALIALALFVIACISYKSDGLKKAYFNFDVPTTDLSYASSSDYYGFQTTFWCTIVVALGLGIVWMAWVHIAPILAPATAFVLAILSLILLGVLTIVNSSKFFDVNGGWKIGMAVTCFFLAIILFSMFWFYSNALHIQAIFLEYARYFLHEVRGTFVYIFIYLILFFGLIALITFQHVAFSSKSSNNTNFWDFTNPGLLGVFNILEFIWGFQFLRDAFNFCVSGAATNFYWNLNHPWYLPLQRLITKHWGSVVGGSFLNGFFEMPTLFVELVTCHKNSCCGDLGESCETICCWGYFFNIVRTDSYSYINLTGLPFCNAGRQCYQNCFSSNSFIGGYNTLKHYRFAASILLTTISYLLSHVFANSRVTALTWWHNVILVVISYAIITWFVNIDADAAEGICTSFLVEHSKAQRYQNMSFAHPVIVNLSSISETKLLAELTVTRPSLTGTVEAK